MINKKRNTFLNSVQKKGFACPGHVAGKQFSYGKYFKTQESLICLKKKQEAEASCFLKNLVYPLNLTKSQHHFISKTIPKKV
jgi:hypothetical protein